MAQYIANPIYDSAFKYMMQNEKSATLLLSALLQRKITDLKIIANDTPVIEEKSGVRILRLDFAATVVNPVTNENELITIELQKSYLDTEIMRFRTYLANKYSDPNNAETVAIYILGHTFQEIEIKKPVIYNYANLRSLTHDTIIVQIPYLKKNAQTKVEQMLEAFCQDYTSSQSPQLLEMNIADKPQDFQELVRPLIYAVADSEVRKVMDIEDEMSAYFQNYKSVTDEVEVFKEMAEEYKGKVEEYKGQAEEYKGKVEEYKGQAEEYKGQAEEYKEKLQEKEAQIVSSMKTMLSFGIPVEKIAESFNKEVNEVKQMLGI
ncbi:MAG: hypothetical protein IJ894_12095 [Bacteroidales bacterium]|nr:hypothetical protein [Bacteroidales bacterium]